MSELLEEGDIDMQEITFNSAAKVARLQHLDALEADKPVQAATEIFRRPAYAYIHRAVPGCEMERSEG